MSRKRLVISKDKIQQRLKELGQAISKDYQGKDLVMIGVLNGAFIFMADLVREIEMPLQLDFLRVASYGSRDISSGEISFTKDVELSLTGKNIILVEDIIDTGRTIAFLKDHFAKLQVDSVKICTLIDKAEHREIEIKADYAGFDISEGFLVGYGMDFAENHRHYPEIYHLETT